MSKDAKLINKKLHAICEDFATNSPLSKNKKEEPASFAAESTNFVIEYSPEKTFTLTFTPDELKQLTSRKLFASSLSKLLAILETESVKPEIHIEAIVSLQTKNKELMKDYFLTLPERKIDFLENNTGLTFYYKDCVSEVEESPIESRISLHDFEILAKLGAGGFATVYLGNYKSLLR